MATVILGGIGSALFGTIGGALGALLGQGLDAMLQSSLRGTISGNSRLGNLRVQSSQEGAYIPKVFGRARLSGQIIWADEFKETTIKRRVGGKYGQKVKEYIYTISFAIGLCEAPISGIGRVWANGKEIDLSQFAYRLYKGNNNEKDPLLEAVLGIGNCPIYTDLAYIVFENMPLEDFGDAIPQLSFEIIANEVPAMGVENLINGICLIPASGEFSLATQPIINAISMGNEAYLNNHFSHEKTDFIHALDNLERDLPSAKNISLVVAWFGDNEKANLCKIEPRVEANYRATRPRIWRVAGLWREIAHKISEFAGENAYGGTIDDAAVIEAIIELKARNMQITFNPFLLMDCPNYPWRGRIMVENDGTNAVDAQINAFYGNVTAAHFSLQDGQIIYSGPDEWSYSRFILHYAMLCKAAGGINAFLLGSELIGLTRARNGQNNFPFVDKLIELAAQVRIILGANCKISYAADWTEYGAYSIGNNVFFPLDKLWANNNIDFIGIDYYAPISDRDESQAALKQSDLQANIEGGEAYDYYYANDAARIARIKTPITDGAYNEAHIFRQKDLRNFWGLNHYTRLNGVRQSNPTEWIAKSKPIRLMEIGYGAIDKAGNRPSIFPDAKSSESGIPPFSNGQRDDGEMRDCLRAFLSYWDESKNPVSNLYSGRMIDVQNTHVWCWDARPFPQFPALSQIWRDAENYYRGHWLMGRMGNGNLAAIIGYCLEQVGIYDFDCDDIDFALDGMIIENAQSGREILEFLLLAFNIRMLNNDGKLVFKKDFNANGTIDENQILLQNNAKAQARDLQFETEVSALNLLTYSLDRDYEICETRIGNGINTQSLSFPIILSDNVRAQIAHNIFAKTNARNDILSLKLPLFEAARLQIGDILNYGGEKFVLSNLTIENGTNLELYRINQNQLRMVLSAGNAFNLPQAFGEPLVFALDLPKPFNDANNPKPKIYIAQNPLIAPIAIGLQGQIIGNITQCAKIGLLENNMAASNIGQKINAPLKVKMLYAQNLPQAGFGAIIRNDEIIDILSFNDPVLKAIGEYELNSIIRGLDGRSIAEALNSGDYFLVLDEAGIFIDWPQDLWGIIGQIEIHAPQNNPPLSLIANCHLKPKTAQNWPVCHIKARRENNGILINFIKRQNGGNDNWENYDNSQNSDYIINIYQGQILKNSLKSPSPSVIYNDEINDFGNLQTMLKLEIFETNQNGQEGMKNIALIPIL